jgi:hypothetical protein
MNAPPPPSNYPRANSEGSKYFIPTRPLQPRFEYISTAFDILKMNLTAFATAALIVVGVMAFVQGLVMNLFAFGSLSPRQNPNTSIAIATSMTSSWILVVIGIFTSFIYNGFFAGIGLMAIESADHGKTQLNTLFKGFRNLPGLVVASILSALCIYAGMLLCVVPGFYVVGVLAFSTYLTVFEGLGGVEALRRSFTLLKPHAWGMFGVVLVAGLVSGIGALVCGFGIIFTLPIFPIVIALHYRDARDTFAQPVYYFPPTS